MFFFSEGLEQGSRYRLTHLPTPVGSLLTDGMGKDRDFKTSPRALKPQRGAVCVCVAPLPFHITNASFVPVTVNYCWLFDSIMSRNLSGPDSPIIATGIDCHGMRRPHKQLKKSVTHGAAHSGNLPHDCRSTLGGRTVASSGS